MPRKFKTPCAAPGCPKLTDGKYCEEHKALGRYEKPKKIQARYDHRWRKIRNRFIAAHPLCKHCLEAGRVTPAEEVDHILPLEHGGTHDENNLQALCKSCHSKKTVRDGDRWKVKTYHY